MNSNQFQPPWFPTAPPNPPMASTFWNSTNVRARLKDLQDTLGLAKAMKKELELLLLIENGKGCLDNVDEDSLPDDSSVGRFLKHLGDRGIKVESQVPLSVASANSLMSKLRFQIEPFRVVTGDMCPWEEKYAVSRLSCKIRKSKRNMLWRRKKRKRIAETLAKERERFEQADREADEWRAREIAKDIAKRKVEKMKEIAKLKANEERNKLDNELELALIVEKLQELRTIRSEKLKKQGHFFPEEDDKFFEKVQAAVVEEERLAIAAADTDATMDAIAIAVGSKKATHVSDPELKDLEKTAQSSPSKNEVNSSGAVEKEPEKQMETQGYDSVGNLPKLTN